MVFLFILSIIGTLLTELVGSGNTTEGRWWKRYKKWFVVTGILLTAISGYFIKSNDDEKFDSVAKTITAKEDRIRELTDLALNTATGGKNFCYMTIDELTPKSNEYAITVYNNGEYPMYNVQMKIFDLILFPELRNKDFSQLVHLFPMPRGKWITDLGELSPHSVSSPKPIQLINVNELIYYVNFSARNGVVHEKFRMKRVGGKWLKAIQVFRFENGKYNKIFEQIDKNYPRSKEDYVL
jgi:hypothetical protein